MKKIVFTAFACVAFLLGVSLSAFSEETFQEHGNRFVGGTWVMNVPDGPTEKHTYTWALSERFLKFHAEEGEHPATFSIIGVDPNNGKRTWWDFRADGSVEQSTVTLVVEKGNVQVLRIDDADGKNTGLFVLTWVSDDLLTGDVNAVFGGKPTPKKQEWLRSKEASKTNWLVSDPPAKIPDGMKIMQKIPEASWIDGRNPEGKKFVGCSMKQWILDGKFVLYSGSSVDEDLSVRESLLVIGLDPKTDLTTGWEFASDGLVALWTVSADGKSLKGNSMNPEGEKFSFVGSFEVVGDTVQYTATLTPEGEKPEPYNWTYHPVK